MTYRHTNKRRIGIIVNNSYAAVPIEQEIRKAMHEKIPIESFSPEIFTERKRGVLPEYDIRTDKWEIAHNAMGKVSQHQVLKIKEKDEKKVEMKVEKNTPSKPNGTEPQYT